MFSIPQLIEKVCVVNKIYDLHDTITFSFNKRFTKRLGDANPNTRHIRLSIPLWERANEAQRLEVVTHEVCHIIVMVKAWKQKTYIHNPHGQEWQEAMKIAGYSNPSKYHTVNRNDLKRKYTQYYLQCGCAKRRVTSHMFALILDKQWHCDKCGEYYKADQ